MHPYSVDPPALIVQDIRPTVARHPA